MGEHHRGSRYVFALGFLVILVGLALNEYILAYAFSPDGELSPETRRNVRFLMAAVIGGGALLCLLRKPLGRPVAKIATRFPDLFAMTFGLFMCVTALGGAELFYFALDTVHGRAQQRVFEAPKFVPGETAHARLSVAGETVYDVTYTLDEAYARVTPGTARPRSKKHFLFFGGSFTFGEGVQDNETLPAAVAKRTPGWRVSNYGFPGHGPAHMLQRLEDPATLESTKDADTRLVYVLIPGHVRRVIGSMRVATAWGRDFPYYTLDDNENIEYRGTFTTGRPRLTPLFRAFSKERIMKHYEVDLPLRLAEGDLELTARILGAARDAFAAAHPAENFIVVLYPAHPTDEFNGTLMAPHLEALDIRYLDYTELFGAGEGYWLKHDLHPTPKANDTLGARLAEDLELSGR